MGRRVFFCFYIKGDLSRANQVRASYEAEGGLSEGFHDISVWREREKKGAADVHELIDTGIAASAVTVVLIGSETADRKYMDYEISQTLARGNGLLGIYIHDLKDAEGNTSVKGAVPAGMIAAGAPIYEWDSSKFSAWVEAAAKHAGK
ncbi:MAG: hypothetical protein JWO36_1698 [Myxococcales bacterium]|nr:hypothetical protein [Myxococcales bacterium]